MVNQANKSNFSWRQFLFPLYPCKILKSTRFLVLIAIIIALRLIMNLVSIPLPGVGMSISLAWVPVMVFGWFFGPVYGLIFGAVTDTLCFFVFNSGYWFWMYAIQEPFVGLLAGLAGSWCRFRQSRKNANMMFDLLGHQVIIFSFASICYIGLILWVNPDNGFEASYYQTYKIISLVAISLFLVVMEIFCAYQISQSKKQVSKLLIFIYASVLVTVLMEVFSFLLGPISAVEYYKFLHHGMAPANYLQYGTIFYLVPRVLVECFKVPIESLVLAFLVLCLNYHFSGIIQIAKNSWTEDK